jgi:hypothetical protein
MNADLAVTYADVPGFPAGSVVAEIVATLTGSAPGNTTPMELSQPPGSAEFSFFNVQADTYAFSIEGLDAKGDTFGTPVTGSVTITGPTTVTLSLPASATASQS